MPIREHPTPVDETLPHFRDLRFLIIDDNPDGRFLIAKTLLRKFPNGRVVECQTADAAFTSLEKEQPSLIVAHRTCELTSIQLIAELRQRARGIPILMTSGIDRKDAALRVGADAFVTYDEWLMVGNYAAQLLADCAAKREQGLECCGAGPNTR